MAQPSKRYPYAIEAEYPTQPGKWFGVEAYANEDEAKAMLPIYAKRVKGTNVRLRDIRKVTS